MERIKVLKKRKEQLGDRKFKVGRALPTTRTPREDA
jgi:hypothetical protein